MLLSILQVSWLGVTRCNKYSETVAENRLWVIVRGIPWPELVFGSISTECPLNAKSACASLANSLTQKLGMFLQLLQFQCSRSKRIGRSTHATTSHHTANFELGPSGTISGASNQPRRIMPYSNPACSVDKPKSPSLAWPPSALERKMFGLGIARWIIRWIVRWIPLVNSDSIAASLKETSVSMMS